MTSSSVSESVLLTRREALKRAALVLGAALTPSIFDGALHAATPGAGSARLLNAAQLASVAAAAERILPKSDTPGAIDVGVPAFIDLMLAAYVLPADREMFMAGLANLEQRSRTTHRRGFAELGAAEQDALLRTIAGESQGKDKSFFALLKELTIVGYFTSAPVGKDVLKYDPVPGRWDPCVPLSEVGNRSYTRG